MITLLFRCLLGAAFTVQFLISPTMGAEGPVPPCTTSALPVHANPGRPASVVTWTAAALPDSWRPPDCLNWPDKNFAVLVAVSGRFGAVTNSEQFLRRLAAVSRLETIKYWSFSRKKWRRLLKRARALEAPDRTRKRRDFTPGEFKPGQDYFIWQKENSLASGVILRTRFRIIADRRIEFDQVNISGSDILAITVLEPYAYQTSFFLEHENGAVWRYYSLTRFGTSDQLLSQDQTASVINRSVALFRYLGGLPMVREPPAAP